jgi:hypothetical protein
MENTYALIQQSNALLREARRALETTQMYIDAKKHWHVVGGPARTEALQLKGNEIPQAKSKAA